MLTILCIESYFIFMLILYCHVGVVWKPAVLSYHAVVALRISNLSLLLPLVNNFDGLVK
jgi:hypothetical protein